MDTQEQNAEQHIPVENHFAGSAVRKTTAEVLALIAGETIKKCVFDFSQCDFIDS